jgi:hypothetical protein
MNSSPSRSVHAGDVTGVVLQARKIAPHHLPQLTLPQPPLVAQRGNPQQWEPVLYLEIGGRLEQLRHLRQLAELPCVSLQFLPMRSPCSAGLDGPFILVETPDHQHLAYAEGQRGSQWVSDADEVSILARKYAMLRTQALTTEDSMGLLDRLLGEQ